MGRLLVVAVFGASVAAASVLLGSCGGSGASQSPSRELSAWVAASQLGSSIGAAEGDDQRIATLAERGERGTTLRTACAVLISDLSTGAAGDLPTPDSELTGELDRAFRDEAASGRDCVSGASGDVAALRRCLSEQAQAEELFAAALDRISAVTGQSISTATTTPPSGVQGF